MFCSSQSSKTRKRIAVESPHGNGDQAENQLLLKAQEVEASLPKKFPTMIIVMLPSHVSNGSSVRLVKGFGPKHLPDEDTVINLEDEDGEIYPIKYLVNKHRFSGGWTAFAMDHKLVCGDVLVFQLVQLTKFKVYIVRASDSYEGDVAHDHLQSENLLKGYKESSNVRSERHESDVGEEDSFGFSISDGIRMCEPAAIDFEQVKSFDDFDIVANGLVINCELSKHLQLKYYELCSSQKLFLHERILNGLNCKLIVGVISETINIADAIRASEFSGASYNTQQKEDFVTWENTLVAFEKLGMNVEFILIRLRLLMSLCDNAIRHKRMKRIDGQMEVDEVDIEVKFREVAKAPWSIPFSLGKGSC